MSQYASAWEPAAGMCGWEKDRLEDDGQSLLLEYSDEGGRRAYLHWDEAPVSYRVANESERLQGEGIDWSGAGCSPVYEIGRSRYAYALEDDGTGPLRHFTVPAEYVVDVVSRRPPALLDGRPAAGAASSAGGIDAPAPADPTWWNAGGRAVRWEPAGGLAGRWELECVTDGRRGLVAGLRGEGGARAWVWPDSWPLLFSVTSCRGAAGDWAFWEVEDSPLADWLFHESCEVLDRADLRHFRVEARGRVLDIVNTDAPKVVFSDPRDIPFGQTECGSWELEKGWEPDTDLDESFW